MLLKCGSAFLVFMVVAASPAPAGAQSSPSKLEGMWSNPPATAVGSLCAFFCPDAGIDRLTHCSTTRPTDRRPFAQLQAEASNHQRDNYIRPRLTAAALKTYPLDPADDPGLLRCEPWGLARQMVAPHQLEIRQRGNDRIELRYGEWDARRTVYMDGRTRPANQAPSRLGHSVGRWEGETLVVETSGVAANQTSWRSEHSDQLRVVEHFTRRPRGIRCSSPQPSRIPGVCGSRS